MTGKLQSTIFTILFITTFSLLSFCWQRSKIINEKSDRLEERLREIEDLVLPVKGQFLAPRLQAKAISRMKIENEIFSADNLKEIENLYHNLEPVHHQIETFDMSKFMQ